MMAENPELHDDLKNQPIKESSRRYPIPDEALQQCQASRNWLRRTMRGGEILEGRIEWFGAYDIKLELATGKSVVVFRHAVYSHSVVQGIGPNQEKVEWLAE